MATKTIFSFPALLGADVHFYILLDEFGAVLSFQILSSTMAHIFLEHKDTHFHECGV